MFASVVDGKTVSLGKRAVETAPPPKEERKTDLDKSISDSVVITEDDERAAILHGVCRALHMDSRSSDKFFFSNPQESADTAPGHRKYADEEGVCLPDEHVPPQHAMPRQPALIATLAKTEAPASKVYLQRRNNKLSENAERQTTAGRALVETGVVSRYPTAQIAECAQSSFLLHSPVPRDNAILATGVTLINNNGDGGGGGSGGSRGVGFDVDVGVGVDGGGAGEPEICQRHGLVACILCSTRNLAESRNLLPAARSTSSLKIASGVATVPLSTALTVGGNQTGSRGVVSALPNPAVSTPKSGLANLSAMANDGSLVRSTGGQPTTIADVIDEGRRAGQDPCERHLLPDCIL